MNEIAERPSLTAAEIRSQVNLIQEVMRGVMKDKEHYGLIPGCQKPSLWKPGAEKLLVTFRIASEPIVEDLSTQDEARYRVIRRGTYIPNGVSVGSSVGECSSNEEKYKWRKAVCDEEFESTPEDRRREKFGKSDGKVYKVKQIRTNHADVANTILKMADKRAYVALALNVTAASDIFTQDIEDLPEGMAQEVEGESSKPPIKEPQERKDGGNSVTFVPSTVSVKEGQGKNGAWVKFGVKSPSGEWYGTFDKAFGALAQEAKASSKPVIVGFEIDGAFKNIVSLALA